MFMRVRVIFPALIFMTLAAAAAAAGIGQGPLILDDIGTITGKILIEGREPMPGGIAAFFSAESSYPPRFAKLRRIPDRVTTVDPGGRFSAELPAGRYYLGVIIRDVNKETGPPGPEEKAFSAVDEGNNRRILEVDGAGEVKDLGPIKVSTPNPARQTADFFTVRGMVIDKDGLPFEGAWILVKRNPHSERPDLISEKTGGDGHFELQLPAGRPYFLIAKDELGIGRPRPGRHVGAYSGAGPVLDQNMPEPKPVPLLGSAGQIVSGINILMIEAPDAELRKETMQGQPIGPGLRTDFSLRE